MRRDRSRPKENDTRRLVGVTLGGMVGIAMIPAAMKGCSFFYE
jgi:hypothetical protein